MREASRSMRLCTVIRGFFIYLVILLCIISQRTVGAYNTRLISGKKSPSKLFFSASYGHFSHQKTSFKDSGTCIFKLFTYKSYQLSSSSRCSARSQENSKFKVHTEEKKEQAAQIFPGLKLMSVLYLWHGFKHTTSFWGRVTEVQEKVLGRAGNMVYKILRREALQHCIC